MEEDIYIHKIAEIEEKLKNFILENFDFKNKLIALKFAHTFRVRGFISEIAKTLALTKRQEYLASVIALFHDYSRFFQIRDYNTLNDLASLDHGDLGYKLLIEENQIENFVSDLTLDEKKLIGVAIKNHNKFAIEPNLTEEQNLFCSLIRDADKIDILKLLSNYSGIFERSVTNVSQEDLDSFYSHSLIKKKKNENFYSNILLELCLIYDINFKKSFEIMSQNNYIKEFEYFVLLWSDFKIDQKVLDCFDYAIDYVNKKANEDEN